MKVEFLFSDEISCSMSRETGQSLHWHQENPLGKVEGDGETLQKHTESNGRGDSITGKYQLEKLLFSWNLMA